MNIRTETASAAVLEEPSLRDRVADAARRAMTAAQDARSLTSVAADAIENQVDSARRAYRSAVRDVNDVRDEAAYRIKRTPFKAVGVAFGAGICLGVVAGAAAWLAARSSRSQTTQTA
ncbi:MAG: hypothetical protein U0Q11_14990 [Vicinamibacterales bacterium]